MALDLKVSVRRQIDRLRKDLAAATERVATLRDEIKRHDLIYDMLAGGKTAKRPRQGRPTAGPLKRGPRRRDDRLECRLRDSARRVQSGHYQRPQGGERQNSILPQAGGCTLVKGGPNQAHRPRHVRENLNARETGWAGVRALGDAVLVLKPLPICLRQSWRLNESQIKRRQFSELRAAGRIGPHLCRERHAQLSSARSASSPASVNPFADASWPKPSIVAVSRSHAAPRSRS